jgi:hypothetical protein
MKHCKKCNMNVRGTSDYCPLCQSSLSGSADGSRDPFPFITTLYKRHNLFFRLLIFGSIAASAILLLINCLIPTRIFWSLFAVGGILCFWLYLAVAVRKRHNIPKSILYQTVLIVVLAVLWDYLTGWRNWSLDYVIPFLFIGTSIALSVTAKVMRMKLDDYFFYLFIHILFGIIPLIFLLTHRVNVLYPSLACVTFSVISLAGLAVFKGEKIVEEFKNRFQL